MSTVPQTLSIWVAALVWSVLFSIIFAVTNLVATAKVIDIMNEYLHRDKTIKEGKIDSESIWKNISKFMIGLRMAIFVVVFVLICICNYGVFQAYLNNLSSPQVTKVTIMTTISIIGLMFLLTNDVSFIKVFENTIGYSVVSAGHMLSSGEFSGTSLEEFMNATIFTYKNENENVARDLVYSKINYDFLLTVFRLDNFCEAMDALVKKEDSDYCFYLTDDEERIKHLLSLVVQKNLVGQLCWIYLATLCATIVSFKFLATDV